jgi:hypothetical protein
LHHLNTFSNGKYTPRFFSHFLLVYYFGDPSNIKLSAQNGNRT